MVVKVFYNFSQFRHGHLKVRQGEQSTIRLQKKEILGFQSNTASRKFGATLILKKDFAMQYCAFITFRVIECVRRAPL